MSNILTRSPRYVSSTNGTALSATLTISVAGVLVYTITKNKDSNNNVRFEISELLRDYLDIDYGNVSTHSKNYSYTLTWYSGLDGTGSFVTALGASGFILDGYFYFEDGYNTTTTRGYLQSNTKIYKLDDADLKIPVDRNNTTKVVYLYNGEILREDTISTSATQAIQYVGTSIDGYEDRVLSDGGTFEGSYCLTEFINERTLNPVDKVHVETTDGLFVIDVINISECKYDPIKLTFVNKWGALQDIWFFKKSVETLGIKKSNYKSFDINGDGSYDVTQHNVRDYDIQSSRSLKINTGYVDESYNVIMKELMQSEKVWIDDDNLVLPVNVDTNSLTFKTSVNDRLVDYTIDIKYAFNEINDVR